MHPYSGEPREILFMHTTPHTLSKGCGALWKLKCQALVPFLTQ